MGANQNVETQTDPLRPHELHKNLVFAKMQNYYATKELCDITLAAELDNKRYFVIQIMYYLIYRFSFHLQFIL